MIELAIIPARGGSVGLPGKNTRPLGGVPLIEWTVRAALASNCFKRVLVNTDCEDIAKVARGSGAEVPFLRPPELATSKAKLSDVLAHTFSEVGVPEKFALLQPTSPFRNANSINRAVDMFARVKAPSLISIVQTKPIEWNYNLTSMSKLVPISRNRNEIHNRQDAQKAYIPNGAIYLCKYSVFEESHSLCHDGTIGLEMSKLESIDIDERGDFEIADSLVKQGLRKIDVYERAKISRDIK